MILTEKKQLLKYYLDLSCAFSGMEKSILFVRFDELAEGEQSEVLEGFRQEISHLQYTFA